jgi:hypothetical protein
MLGMVLRTYYLDFLNNIFIVRHLQILVALKSGDGILSNESKDGILSSEFILSTTNGINYMSKY